MGSRQKRSKKRSDPSTLPRRAFYLDESIGSRLIADALKNQGQDVYRCNDVCRDGATDEDWLHIVGPKGWIILTRDDNIRRRASEIQAVRDAGAMLFFVQGGKTGAEQTAIVIQQLKSIIRVADNYEPPFMASVVKTDVAVQTHRFLPEPRRRSAIKRR